MSNREFIATLDDFYLSIVLYELSTTDVWIDKAKQRLTQHIFADFYNWLDAPYDENSTFWKYVSSIFLFYTKE